MLRNKLVIAFALVGTALMIFTAGKYHFEQSSPQVVKAPQGMTMPPSDSQEGMPSGAMNMSNMFGNEDIDPAFAQRAGELMQRMQANANDPQVAIELAILFLEAEDYLGSLNFATRASMLDPTNANAAYLMAIAHSQLGEYNEAVAEFNRSLALNETAATHYSLAIVYKYNLNNNEMAKIHLEKALNTPDITEEIKGFVNTELENL